MPGAEASRAGFREIEHTADVGFEIWAEDLAGLFVQATRALAGVCYDRAGVRPAQRRALRVQGAGNEQLLVHWLQEVYLQLELDSWLTADVGSLRLGEDAVEGVLLGEPFEAGRHVLHTEIKAVTYHNLQIARDADAVWRTRLIIDV